MSKAKIIIGNSFCKIQGFSETAIRLIKSSLTYDDQEAMMELQQLRNRLQIAIYNRNGRQIGWYKKLVKETEARIEVCWLLEDCFPTGHLPMIERELLEAKISYELLDNRTKPQKSQRYQWLGEEKESRYYQKDMVDLGINAHRGVFESAVGSGKTFILQQVIQKLGVNSLVVAPAIDLGGQIYDSFVEAFGKKQVGLLETSRLKKSELRKPIKITTIHTLKSAKKKGFLGELLKGVELLALDEIHHAASKTYTDLLPDLDHIYYKYGFSGTFLRNDSKTMDLHGVLSDVLYRYPAHQGIADGFLTPIEVLVHDIKGIKAQKYQTEYKKNYCGGSAILYKILDIMDNFVQSNEQVLILVNRKDTAGKLIWEFLQEHEHAASYISGDDDKEKIKKVLKFFNNKTIRVLIGSTIIGEGIDVKSTDHLIMAQGGKSEIAITQAVGRAVRLFPEKSKAWIHDFNFLNTKYMQKHLIERINIYEKNFNAPVSIL